MIKGSDNPWRNALRLEFNFPTAVRGPVERVAFLRLASICLAVAI